MNQRYPASFRPLPMLLALLLSASGYAESQNPHYQVHHSDSAVRIDGSLDDSIWKKAPNYPMSLSSDQSKSIQEGGYIQIAYDQEHLYLGINLEDSDVIQEMEKDQLFHFEHGDVTELFLKPKDAPYYWELYVTPNQRKMVFFFEGAGRRFLKSSYNQPYQWLQVAAQIDGSLNNPRDKDRGWTAEMAVPLSVLAEKGIPFDGKYDWTILVGRYNYSLHLPEKELSMSPAQPATNFHTPEHWASLIPAP